MPQTQVPLVPESSQMTCQQNEEQCLPGASCVPQLPSPRERLGALQTAVATESEPLVTLTHLLRLCRDDHRLLWERVGDPASQQRAAAALLRLRAHRSTSSAALEPEVRHLMAAALEPIHDVPAVLLARALASFVDDRYGETFAGSFRRRSPYQPSVGDPVPLDSPNVRAVTALQPTSPPWRLANRLDETRRVRLAGDWAIQFQVVFDYSLDDTLTGLIGPDTVVATCHPNSSLSEFDLTGTVDGGTFPVLPNDSHRQRAEINRLLDTAEAGGASIVVLPELCTTETLAAELHERVRRPGALRLLVAGSYHHRDPRQHPGGGSARRRNSAVCWVRGHDRPLVQDKHSPGDRPIAEGIQPQGWPQLRIYVTADGWHLAVAICRDLLNPQAVNALTEAGANVILVPAMSQTLMPFGGVVAHLVGSRQAIVAVANNPARWAEHSTLVADSPARALFGHPGFGQQTRFVRSADAQPGVALLTVRSAQLTWQPVPHPARDVRQSGPTDAAAPPDWLAPIAASTDAPTARPDGPVSLRQAAVLVLLTDGPRGPQVLLTERASDLADYPARLTFPGGARAPGDDGPVATALREAAEEVGLDPDRVVVVGVLPSFALPESGFMATPVVGWLPSDGDARPAGDGPVNLAEVTAVHHVPFTDLRARHDPPSPTGARAAAPPDLAALGSMTAAVVDLLLGTLTGEASAATSGDRSFPPDGNQAEPTGTTPDPWTDSPLTRREAAHVDRPQQSAPVDRRGRYSRDGGGRGRHP